MNPCNDRNRLEREVRIHQSEDELASNLAEYVLNISDAAISDRGVFAIAISGGSVISLMRKLCEAPYKKIVDWTKWYVFWADERVVSKNHADSNYKLARDGLFSRVPILHSHINPINDSLNAEQAAEDYEFLLRQLVKTRIINASEVSDCPKFDLILLGMGPDGHVASLFPDHSVLHDKEQWVAFITDSPKPPPERITLTMPVINSAKNVAILVMGCNKAEAVRLAMDEIGPECDLELPARMVRPATGKLVWFVDVESASKLDDDGAKFC